MKNQARCKHCRRTIKLKRLTARQRLELKIAAAVLIGGIGLLCAVECGLREMDTILGFCQSGEDASGVYRTHQQQPK